MLGLDPDRPPLILNVDDNELARSAVSLLLRQVGLDVREAASGEEALLLLDNKPDLVLLDVNLGGGMDGFEVCSRLKAEPATALLPVILISAISVRTEDRVRALEEGADGYLTKPIDPADLVAHIKALLRARRAETAQRQSERRFQAAFEHATVGMAIADLDGRYVEANPAFCRITGYAREELLVTDFLSVTHPEDREPNRNEIRRLLDGDVPALLIEKRYVRRDGAVIWAKNSISLVHDEEGKPLHLITLAEDISDRKRAEGRLRRREQHLRAVIDTTPDCVKVVAPDGTVVEMNSAGLAILEADEPGAVIGKSVYPLLAPEHRDAYRAFHESVCQGRRGTMTYDFLGLKGRRRTVESVAAPLTVSGGRRLHLAVTRDVTETKTLEAQLRQAQKMEAIGQLAGGVAHDFNNLLCIINGYSDILFNALWPDDPMRNLVDEIRKAGERSASLTRQLLAFSRKQVIAPRVLDLNTVILDLEKMLRRVLGEDIDLATSLTPGLGSIKADPGQVEQVLLNLLVNARDAMPQGGKLAIETQNVNLDEDYARARSEVRPGPYVLLAVSDTGCGMTAEVKAHLFEPFFTTKGPGQGTGLGLATVYGIVEQSGGHVAVNSEPGLGTTFRVYLPIVEAAVQVRDTRAATAPAPRGSETILLVEDDEGVRALTRHALQSSGYTVLVAREGQEALRIGQKRQEPIDLLVSDVVMPGLGGRQLSERLRLLHPEMKVLFLSGYTDDAVVRHGVLEGEVNFLQKPFSPAVLARKVRDVLDEIRPEGLRSNSSE